MANVVTPMFHRVMKDLTIDEIRLYRPDLYQEIVEDVLMSGFAGRTDEVYDFIIPTINDMRKDVKEITDQLKYDLSRIIERKINHELRNTIEKIEKGTRYKAKWKEEEKKKIYKDLLENEQVQKDMYEAYKTKKLRDSIAEKDLKKANNKKNQSSLISSPPKYIKYKENVNLIYKQIRLNNVTSKKRYYKNIHIGDYVEYGGKLYKVFDIKIKYGINTLICHDEQGNEVVFRNYNII